MDDERVFPLYDYAFSKGLIVLWHAGYDPIGTPPYRSNPRRFAALADRFDGAKWSWRTSADRNNGWKSQNSSRGKRVDGHLYGDAILSERPLRVHREKHGADRVVFASDSPWSDTAEAAEMIRNCDFTPEDKEKYFTARRKNCSGCDVCRAGISAARRGKISV